MDFHSYLGSLHNLKMLKLLFDYGISIDDFGPFLYHIEFTNDTRFDIFLKGLKHLFDEVKVISYSDQDRDEEEKVILNYLLESKSIDKVSNCEYQMVISDSIFRKAIEQDGSPEKLKAITVSIDNKHETESSWLKNNEGFYFSAEYIEDISGVLNSLIDLKELALKLATEEEVV